MPNYRAYVADRHGRVLATETIDAPDDADAIKAARRLTELQLANLSDSIGSLELWIGSGPRSATRVPG
jgi:hypothetical protein